MTGAPQLIVKLDDGTGTYPYDISAYVHLPSGMRIAAGRRDEDDEIAATTLDLTLKATDGRFALGSVTYGIVVDQRIRVQEVVAATTVTRFVGYVQAWPTEWDSGIAATALIRVRAVDRFARLERRKLRAGIEAEVLANGPAQAWPLSEPVGSMTAGSLVSTSPVPLGIYGSGTAPVFGAESGNYEGLTGVQFAAGKYLGPATLPSFASAYGARATYKGTGTGGILIFTGLLSLIVSLDGSGKPQVNMGVTVITGSAAINDGLPHDVAVALTSTLASPGGTVTLYVDGVSAGSSAVSLAVPASGFLIGDGLTGVLSQVALYGATPTAGQVANQASALTGFAGESSNARIARLASYANIAPADQTLGTGLTTSLGPQSTAGVSVADAMRETARAEGGVVYIDKTGQLRFRSRSYPVLQITAPGLLLAPDDISPDVVVQADKDYLINEAIASRPEGATQRAVSQSSVDQYEQYLDGVTSYTVATDEEVYQRVNWRVGNYSTITPRVSSLRVDLMTQASSALVLTALAVDIGGRVAASSMPSQSPIASPDLRAEGWSEELTLTSWTVDFNTVPASLFSAWILNASALDSTTRLYF